MAYSEDELKAYLAQRSLDWRRLVLLQSNLVAFRDDDGQLLAFITDDGALHDALESFLIRMGQVEATAPGTPLADS